MDSSRPDRPTRPVFDVVNPGVGAPPNSRPVFTNNQPQQVDPMMAPPRVTSMPVAPTPDGQAQKITVEQPQPALVTQTVTTEKPVLPPAPQTPTGPVHALQHQEAFYGEIRKPGRGKKVLVAVLILLLIGGIGFGGWIYMQKQDETRKKNDAAKAQSTVVATPTIEKDEDKIFTSKSGLFTISNDYDWKIQEADLTDTYRGVGLADAKYGKILFTINDKQYLEININPGSTGNECSPATKDKPFTKGNVCASTKILSAEKLSTKSFSASTLGDSVAGVYLEKIQYMAPTDEKPITIFGIGQSAKDGATAKELPPEIGKETMGNYKAYTTLAIKNGYVDIKIVDKDGKPTQLTDDDLEKVSIILKTLKLTSAN